MTDAVADTGPFIHLAEIEAAWALKVFRNVVVPAPVAAELEVRPLGAGAALLKLPNVRGLRPTVQQASRSRILAASMRLAATDAAALAVAEDSGAILLTDDLDLRDSAKTLSVASVGTVGILIRAATAGVRPRSDVVHALERRIEDASLFITRSLIDRAKNAIRDAGT